MTPAMQLRKAIGTRGRGPVQGWAACLLLRLDDPTLLDLHDRCRHGVPALPPTGVSMAQVELMQKFVAIRSVKNRQDRGRAVDVTEAQVAERIGKLVGEAQAAQAGAERWLQDRLPQQPHRRR